MVWQNYFCSFNVNENLYITTHTFVKIFDQFSILSIGSIWPDIIKFPQLVTLYRILPSLSGPNFLSVSIVSKCNTIIFCDLGIRRYSTKICMYWSYVWYKCNLTAIPWIFCSTCFTSSGICWYTYMLCNCFMFCIVFYTQHTQAWPYCIEINYALLSGLRII